MAQRSPRPVVGWARRAHRPDRTGPACARFRNACTGPSTNWAFLACVHTISKRVHAQQNMRLQKHASVGQPPRRRAPHRSRPGSRRAGAPSNHQQTACSCADVTVGPQMPVWNHTVGRSDSHTHPEVAHDDGSQVHTGSCRTKARRKAHAGERPREPHPRQPPPAHHNR